MVIIDGLWEGKGTWKTDPEFGNTTRFHFLVERGFLPERKMSL